MTFFYSYIVIILASDFSVISFLYTAIYIFIYSLKNFCSKLIEFFTIMEIPSLITSTQVHKLLHGTLKYILLDIDGVLWSGDKVIHGSREAIQHFRRENLQVRFLSNNASVSRQQLHQRLLQRGFAGVSEREVYNSGYVASLRLAQLLGRKRREEEKGLVVADEKTGLDTAQLSLSTMPNKVYGNILVIGEQGLHEEIKQVLAEGFITYGLELQDPKLAMGEGGYQGDVLAKGWTERVLPAPLQPLPICDGMTCRVVQAGQHDAGDQKISLANLNPVAVVVGLDLHFNILKLAVAAMALLGPPADVLNSSKDAGHSLCASPLFIATNEDPQIPYGSSNVLLPGAGTMVRAVCTAVGRARPDVICGKPFVDMAEAFMTAENVSKSDVKESCLMIGDRLTTDVAFGNAAGMSSMLVLSGAESMKDLEKAAAQGRKELIPTYVAKSLADFLPLS